MNADRTHVQTIPYVETCLERMNVNVLKAMMAMHVSHVLEVSTFCPFFLY